MKKQTVLLLYLSLTDVNLYVSLCVEKIDEAMKNPIQMIKQCNEKDEPYFLLRGQDLCALAAIETYYHEVKQRVTDPYFIEEIEEIMKDFRAYREELDRVKIPD